MARMYTLKTIEEKRKFYLKLKKDLQEFLTLTRKKSFLVTVAYKKIKRKECN